jgi:peptidoglycan/xylan/chitin deacetylase (PgdA/CDA1 family)
MKIVSPLLRRVVYPGLSRTGYLRRRMPAAPLSVTYHGILPDGYQPVDAHLDGNLVTAQQFRSQIRFLKTDYEIISPDDFRDYCLGKCMLPARAVLLTCDDGLKNHVTMMLPILSEMRVRCLFFVTGIEQTQTFAMLWHEQLYWCIQAGGNEVSITQPELGKFRASGIQGKRELWRSLVDRLSSFGRDERGRLLDEILLQLRPSENGPVYENELPTRERFVTLNNNELRRLADAGMTIGAHTDSHPRLSRMSDELVRREMLQNRQQLETILGQPVWALAYPFGDAGAVSLREMVLAEECGFTCAFMNVQKPHEEYPHRFALPRIHITADLNIAELQARLSGFHAFLQGAFYGLSGRAV